MLCQLEAMEYENAKVYAQAQKRMHLMPANFLAAVQEVKVKIQELRKSIA